MFRRIRQRLSREGKPFPIERSSDREIPSDFQGVVITSDIDKTYLATEFETVGKLLKTALEPASDKVCVPGMDVFLRGLQRGGEPNPHAWPLYFVSASPPQMRKVLEQKMLLDSVHADGISFKDQFWLLRRRRVEQITGHLLYKFTALLLNRAERPAQAAVQEILVGDDSETDAETYILYARLLDGSLPLETLERKLVAWGATRFEQQHVLSLAERQDQARVARIYIHRTVGRPLQKFAHLHSPLLMMGNNSFEMAMDAMLRGWTRIHEVARVAESFPITTVRDSWQFFLDDHPDDQDLLQALGEQLRLVS